MATAMIVLSPIRLLALVAIVALVIFIVLAFANVVPEYGSHIGSSNLRMDWLIAVGWSIILGIVATWTLGDRQEAQMVFLGWNFHAVICLFFSLWYEDYYDFLDAYVYFRQSSDVWGEWTIGIGGGTENIILLCWLHQQVFPGCYHVMKVSFAAVGFLGLRYFYAAAKTAFPNIVKPYFFLTLSIIPGIAFWSSIIGKDPIMFLAVGVYAYGSCIWISGSNRRGWIYIAIGILLGALIRPWIAPVLAVPLVYFSVMAISDIRWRIIYGAISAIVLAFTVGSLLDLFMVDSVTSAVMTANEISKGWATGGSAQQVEEVDSVGSLGIALPWWVFSFMFRPFPGEISNIFGFFSGCENIVMLILCVWSLYWWWAMRIRHPVLTWMAIYVLVYAVVFAVPGYQNLGSAARWRLPMVPFLIGIFSFIWAVRYKLSADTTEKMFGSAGRSEVRIPNIDHSGK